MMWSGLRISTSELASMSEALTGPGPSNLNYGLFTDAARTITWGDRPALLHLPPVKVNSADRADSKQAAVAIALPSSA